MASLAGRAIPRSFPANPADGDEWIEAGRLYRWDASISAWRLVGPAPPPEDEDRIKHDQSPAANIWIVPHNLQEKYVSVQVIDPAGNTIIPDVDWPASTVNAVRLVFCKPKDGSAIIRR